MIMALKSRAWIQSPSLRVLTLRHLLYQLHHPAWQVPWLPQGFVCFLKPTLTSSDLRIAIIRIPIKLSSNTEWDSKQAHDCSEECLSYQIKYKQVCTHQRRCLAWGHMPNCIKKSCYIFKNIISLSVEAVYEYRFVC